jgi:hypothetical protein
MELGYQLIIQHEKIWWSTFLLTSSDRPSEEADVRWYHPAEWWTTRTKIIKTLKKLPANNDEKSYVRVVNHIVLFRTAQNSLTVNYQKTNICLLNITWQILFIVSSKVE